MLPTINQVAVTNDARVVHTSNDGISVQVFRPVRPPSRPQYSVLLLSVKVKCSVSVSGPSAQCQCKVSVSSLSTPCQLRPQCSVSVSGLCWVPDRQPVRTHRPLLPGPLLVTAGGQGGGGPLQVTVRRVPAAARPDSCRTATHRSGHTICCAADDAADDDKGANGCRHSIEQVRSRVSLACQS